MHQKMVNPMYDLEKLAWKKKPNTL